jgi:ankyrin repeat protein
MKKHIGYYTTLMNRYNTSEEKANASTNTIRETFATKTKLINDCKEVLKTLRSDANTTTDDSITSKKQISIAERLQRENEESMKDVTIMQKRNANFILDIQEERNTSQTHYKEDFKTHIKAAGSTNATLIDELSSIEQSKIQIPKELLEASLEAANESKKIGFAERLLNHATANSIEISPELIAKTQDSIKTMNEGLRDAFKSGTADPKCERKEFETHLDKFKEYLSQGANPNTPFPSAQNESLYTQEIGKYNELYQECSKDFTTMHAKNPALFDFATIMVHAYQELYTQKAVEIFRTEYGIDKTDTELTLESRQAKSKLLEGKEEHPSYGLYKAISEGDVEQVQNLTKGSFENRPVDIGGGSPLQFASACNYNSTKIIAILQNEKKATLTLQEQDATQAGMQADHIRQQFLIAAKDGHLENCKLLLNEKVTFKQVKQMVEDNPVDDALRTELDSNTPLTIAAQYGKGKAMRFLVNSGRADINKPRDDGNTALTLAAQHGHGARYLLSAGADINPTTKDGSTALHLAAEADKHIITRQLLEKAAETGAETGAETEAETRAAAAEKMRIAMAEYLKKPNEAGKKALDDATGDMRNLLLVATIATGNEAEIKALAQTGVDVDTTDKNGKTALHMAVNNGDIEAVKLLKKCGANPDIQDLNRNSPLKMAVENDDIETVKLLIELGATVDILDEDECTPLYEAVLSTDCQQNNTIEIITALLEAGANIYNKNSEGKDALKIAEDLKKECVDDQRAIETARVQKAIEIIKEQIRTDDLAVPVAEAPLGGEGLGGEEAAGGGAVAAPLKPAMPKQNAIDLDELNNELEFTTEETKLRWTEKIKKIKSSTPTTELS